MFFPFRFLPLKVTYFLFFSSVEVLIILYWTGTSINTETIKYQTSYSIVLLLVYVNCFGANRS